MNVWVLACRLPIDTATGESVYAEASVQGKKKEAVLQCALNACRILDAHDMLRENSQSEQVTYLQVFYISRLVPGTN